MLLSIIIPFYQVEKYLPDCLAGLSELPAEQTEIILVDDCGEDSSFKIAEKWAAKHSNACIVKRKCNGGLSAARNTGLSIATGEYIFFLDSDDIPLGDMLWKLTLLARDNDLDILKASFSFYLDESNKIEKGIELPITNIKHGATLFSEECRLHLYEPMVWQCIYKRSFLQQNQLKMIEGLLFEDEVFQASALLKAERTASNNSILLLYRLREGSIMKSFATNATWCSHYLIICDQLKKIAYTAPNDAKQALNRRIAEIALNIARNIQAYKLQGKVFEQAMQFLIEHKRVIGDYAMSSKRAILMIQGWIIKLNPRIYLNLYAVFRFFRKIV